MMSRFIAFISGHGDPTPNTGEETEADRIDESHPMPLLICTLHRALVEIGYSDVAHAFMSMTDSEHRHIIEALENEVSN